MRGCRGLWELLNKWIERERALSSCHSRGGEQRRRGNPENAEDVVAA
jgi:hypothetical protein